MSVFVTGAGTVPTIGMPTSDLEVGKFIQIIENGSPVKYRVIHQGNPDSSIYDASCNGTWVVREYIHSKMKWHSSTGNNYQVSNTHTYLNGDFLALFDNKTQALIKQVKIPHWNGNGSTGSLATGSNGLSTKIFLLGGYEVGWTTAQHSKIATDGACLSYFSGTADADSKRIAYIDVTATSWWLRSPYTGNTTAILRVDETGGYTTSGYSVSYGIRPAMILEGKVNSKPNDDDSYTLLT